MRYDIQLIDSGKRLILSRPFDSAWKWMDGILGIFVLAAGLAALAVFFDVDSGPGAQLFPLVIFAICTGGALRLSGAALKREWVDCTEGIIVHTSKGINTRIRKYDVKHVNRFRHVHEEEWINGKYHVLKLAFDHDGETIVLGHEIYSWDFEALQSIFFEISGNDLRYTDEEEAQPGFDPEPVNPEEAENAFDQTFQEKIDAHGWGIIQIEDTDYLPSFAFTVGLWERFQHPELICIGLDIDNMQGILNEAGERIRKGETIQTGISYEGTLEGYFARFVSVHESYFKSYLGYANWYNKGTDYPCLQLVWTDKNGLYPFDEDCGISPYRQPLLDRNIDFKFLEKRNSAVFISREWKEKGQFIRRVIHDEIGEWVMLSNSDELDVICVSHEQAVSSDLSLNELFNLDYGEEAERTEPGGEWKRKRSKETV